MSRKKDVLAVNGEMVTLAREYRGLSQTALAQSVGVRQQAVARLESGDSSAMADTKIALLYRQLGFPPLFFESDAQRLGFGSSSYFYRTRITSAKDRKRIASVTNLLRLCLEDALKVVDFQGRYDIPRYLADGHNPVDAAAMIRMAWNVPDGPITNLTRLVEQAGAVILEANFGSNIIDGTSLCLGGLPPLIFINKNLAADRYRFTLAHELGHVVMHDVPNEYMEPQANLFAGALLMDDLSFRRSYSETCHGKPSLRGLMQMKRRWNVSVGSMIYRLGVLEKIDERQKRSLNIQLSRKGWRSSPEPQFYEKESPRAFAGIMSASGLLDAHHTGRIGTDVLRDVCATPQILQRTQNPLAQRKKMRLLV